MIYNLNGHDVFIGRHSWVNLTSREARLVVRQRPADEDHPGERHRQKGRQADRNADRREAGGVAERDE